MVSEWKEYKLKEVIEKFIDYRGKTPTKTDMGVPLITAKIIKDGRILEPNEFIAEDYYEQWMTRGYPEINDVVLTTEAPLGEVALLKNKNVALGQRIITLRGKKDLCDNAFLKYYLQSNVGQATLQSRAQGSTVEGIKSAELREIEVFLPHVEEQKAIASILSSLDDKIDLLHRQNKTLEVMAETLFRQWFVEEAEEGWKMGKLGDIADINPTYQLKNRDISSYLEMSNVSTSTFNPEGWYKREFSSGMKFKNGDTLLARITPCLENGKTCYVTFLDEEEIGWGSTEYIVIRMRKPFHPFISYIIAKDNDFRDFAISSMSGSSGRQRAQADVIKEYEIKIPPLAIIEKLNLQLAGIIPKLEKNANQIRTLTRLRDTLLPNLMSGEVRVNI